MALPGLLDDLDMQNLQRNDCLTCLKVRQSFRVPASWKSLLDILQDTEESNGQTANIGRTVFEQALMLQIPMIPVTFCYPLCHPHGSQWFFFQLFMTPEVPVACCQLQVQFPYRYFVFSWLLRLVHTCYMAAMTSISLIKICLVWLRVLINSTG